MYFDDGSLQDWISSAADSQEALSRRSSFVCARLHCGIEGEVQPGARSIAYAGSFRTPTTVAEITAVGAVGGVFIAGTMPFCS